MTSLIAIDAAPARTQHTVPDGEPACKRLWERLRLLESLTLLSLPPCAAPLAPAALALLEGASERSLPPHGAIAAEVEHGLLHGVRPGTALALLLLAILAADRYDSGPAPLRVAAVAVDIAVRDGGAHAWLVRALHAGLVLPRTAPWRQVAAILASLAQDEAAAGHGAVQARRLLAGAAMAAGLPLPEQAGQLEAALPGGRATGIVAARYALLCELARPAAPRRGAPACFAGWSTELQAAFHADDAARAGHAVAMAAPLAGPFTPPAELLCHHLFTLLMLARSGGLACLATAAGHHCEGDTSAALRGYEAAAADAAGQDMDWLATLAWDMAAAVAGQAGFATAQQGYRRLAINGYAAWGAAEHARRLARAWRLDRCPAPAAPAADLGLSIAHEVNQPLAAVMLHAAAARKWLRRPQPDTGRAIASLDQIVAAGRQAGEIVRSVQRLAGHGAAERSLFAPDEALREALQLLGHPLQRHQVAVELDLALGARRLHGDRAQLQQVVVNLLLNAIEALAGVAGRPRRIVLASRPGARGTAEITVADNGPGIARAERARIFEPMVSTKPGGTGIGLSISLAIVQAHGGSIEAAEATPQGALLSIVLPLPA
ncbi:ATP-binding protein [Massilia yuzhufengensis]|uniref:histidine kinase n=1 Tax=Massilia yuzhufengensis TaxID=1164594 RepID=A0A1I1E785_9BURK|nr:ATP-binding protein [Massilia yuzhufengensis]SFB82971.1 Histidine kinase-, DNA gyrase B-, and HSP90-like ATPase [Massilia yuzhufengensis]